MIWKHITYFSQPAVVGCDGKCDKAWGINQRPSVPLGGDPDDYAWLADSELDTAPTDPGTYEGGDAKPMQRPMTGDAMNKWCVRECERSDVAQSADDLDIRDFARRVYNMPAMHNDA